MTVDALNALMPELNLSIDEQTGLVQGGTDAIYDHIQALKDQAVAEGIEKGTGLVVDAARTQAFDLAHASKEFLSSARDATMPTIPAPAYYQDAGQAPTLRGSAQLQATLEVPVYLDGREIARSTAHYMGEQMEFEVM